MQARSPDTLVPVVRDPGHAPGGEEALTWWWETGTGYAHDDCGTFLRTVAACGTKPGAHKPLRIPNSCGRASCPVCWETWAERAGSRVRDSLEGYMSLVYGNSQQPLPGMRLDKMRARHIVLSPPRKLIAEWVQDARRTADGPEFQRTILRMVEKEALKVIRKSGLAAGIMIVHGIRLKRDRDSRAADMHNSTNRYREILDRPDWRDHVVWYPHVHLLAYGSLDSFEVFHRTTGWIYRVFRAVEEPERVVRYLLSHAPTVPYRKAYVPFGRMNSRHMIKTREYCCRMPVTCEECVKEGRPDDEAERVIAILAEDEDGRPCMECEHDHDIDARHRARGSRGDPVAWSFESVSSMRYTKVKRRFVYGWKVLEPPGRGPPRRVHRRPSAVSRGHQDIFGPDRRVWVRPEVWDSLVESGAISSWYVGET